MPSKAPDALFIFTSFSSISTFCWKRIETYCVLICHFPIKIFIFDWNTVLLPNQSALQSYHLSWNLGILLRKRHFLKRTYRDKSYVLAVKRIFNWMSRFSKFASYYHHYHKYQKKMLNVGQGVRFSTEHFYWLLMKSIGPRLKNVCGQFRHFYLYL